MYAKSFAKVNLFLHALSRYQNNYHEIQSYFIRTELFDEITIEPYKKYLCEVLGPSLCGPNIVDKIILSFESVLQRSLNFKVVIKKNIPISAGLGGGSGNAATVVLLLLNYFKPNKQLSQLIHHKIQSIGSDIAFFLQKGNAFVEGVGNRVTPVRLGVSYFILLVNSGIRISSKVAYENLQEKNFSKKISCNRTAILNSVLHGSNDLEKFISKEYQEIRDLLKFLLKQSNCLVSRMTGSGSTCFGIFSQLVDLNQAVEAVKNSYPLYWLHAEKILL